jgi:hypothetical protein
MRSFEALSWLAGGLPPAERPTVLRGGLEAVEDGSLFDIVLARNWLVRLPGDTDKIGVLAGAAALTAAGGKLLIAETDPSGGTTLSDLVQGVWAEDADRRFRAAESVLREKLAAERSADAVLGMLTSSGWAEESVEPRSVDENRYLDGKLLKSWFDQENTGGYGARMAEIMGPEIWLETAAGLTSLLEGRTVLWRTGLRVYSALKNG